MPKKPRNMVSYNPEDTPPSRQEKAKQVHTKVVSETSQQDQKARQMVSYNEWEDAIPSPDRDQRVATTRQLQGTVLSRGGDSGALGGVFGALGRIIFGTQKPQGDRDNWRGADQHRIMMAEQEATKTVGELPVRKDDPKNPRTKAEQRSLNQEIISKAEEGGRKAKAYQTNDYGNGNWTNTIADIPPVEVKSQKGFLEKLMGDDMWTDSSSSNSASAPDPDPPQRQEEQKKDEGGGWLGWMGKDLYGDR